MNVAQRRELLVSLQSRLLPIEAESIADAELERVFLPLHSHRLALRTEVVLVLGGRGAGKSALFRLLSSLASGGGERVRRFFGPEVPSARWIDAFSDAVQHPQHLALDDLAKSMEGTGPLRGFWVVHLARRVSQELGSGAPPLPAEIAGNIALGAMSQHASLAAQYIDSVEAALASSGQVIFASYDHLDRLGQFDRGVRQRYVSSLLALWLSLSNRYRHLRGKIFLREDLFDAAQSTFADASKLRGRSVSIEWDVPSLYRLVLRYMAANTNVYEWLSGIQGLTFAKWDEFGVLPPEMDERLQRSFAERLAGRLMGSGVKKGYTYRWIPNRLQDGKGRIVPRSILNLIGNACKNALNSPESRGERLVTPQNLWTALEPTSTARVHEVSEEFPAVRRLEHLRGLQVLIDRNEVIKKLALLASGEQEDRAIPGTAVFEELERLGVLVVRDDRYGQGRVDIPDIYRYGYGILRKGGVRRPS